MPFTPLHLGLGASCKAIGKHRFSLLIFSGTQVLMDIEPLLGLIKQWSTLHFYTHNLLGALAIGGIALVIGKPVSEQFLKWSGYQYHRISWYTASISAFTGSISHVILDAFMHADMYPFFPFSLHNPLLNQLSYQAIFYLCITSLIIGSLIAIFRLRPHRE